jgi:hypothetical protein
LRYVFLIEKDKKCYFGLQNPIDEDVEELVIDGTPFLNRDDSVEQNLLEFDFYFVIII